MEMTYRLYPDRTPRAIVLTVTEGPNPGKTFRGIYTLKGDTFKICRNVAPGKARPTRFAAPKDSGLLVVTWKRQRA